MEYHGDQIRTPTVLYRGGTSKAFFVWRDDLPTQSRDEIEQWILAIYGSPDRRQIDGVGGADALTSKFAIIGPPTRPDADVDYLFAQVGVEDPTINWSIICGNISSAVGPYAIERGLVAAQSPVTSVRIHSVNTGKIVRAEVQVDQGRPRVIGDQRIDGVPGSGAPVLLDLSDTVSTQGSGLLPTDNVRDTLNVPGIGEVEFSLVDVALPLMFVRPERFGFTGTEGPLELLAAPEKLAALDTVRCYVSAHVGWASSPEAARIEKSLTPSIALISPPRPWQEYGTLRERGADDCDFHARSCSYNNAHKAYPVTGSIATGVAAAIEGSLVHGVARATAHRNGQYRIGHASGVIDVVIDVDQSANGVFVRHSGVVRTARRLLEGHVFASRERLPFLDAPVNQKAVA